MSLKTRKPPGGEVGRALGPPASGVQALHPLVAADPGEPLVEHLEHNLDHLGHTETISRAGGR